MVQVGADVDISVTATLLVKSCPVCGIMYAAPAEFFERRDDDGKHWYCPVGHSIVFTESREAQLQAEKNRAARLREKTRRLENDLLDEVKRRQSLEREKKRVENRIHAGVCPYCRRNFVNLQRHMEGKHPHLPIRDEVNR